MHFKDALQLGGHAARCRFERDLPLRSPSSVAEIVRLELVVLDADRQQDLAAVAGSPKHRRHAVAIVVGCVRGHLSVKSGAPRLDRGVQFVRLKVGRFFPQVIIAADAMRIEFKLSHKTNLAID